MNGTRNAETIIFHSGGGNWCGVFKAPGGEWASGTLNGQIAFYKTERAAREFWGNLDPDFVRFAEIADLIPVMDMWKEAISNERDNRHGLAEFCSEWLEENEKMRNKPEEFVELTND